MIDSLPLVTIVIPSYNHQDYIKEAILSVIDQDYKNIELIIIDDGSKDNSINIILEMCSICEKRFERFEFRHRENRGICETLNEALNWSSGIYFAPSASDDALFFNKISSQVQAFRDNDTYNIAGVLSGISIFNNDGLVIKTIRGSNKTVNFKDVLIRKIPLPGSAVMFSVDKLKNVGGFDSKFKIEDFFIFLKLTEGGDTLFFMDSVLVNYRRHEKNLSSKHEVMWTAVEEILNEYKGHDAHLQARANSMMIQAHSIQSESFTESAMWALRSLKTYPINFFSISFYKLILKYIVPMDLLSRIKKL